MKREYTLNERAKNNLIACINAELEFLAISGKDYTGPLKVEEIMALGRLIDWSTRITLELPDPDPDPVL